MASVWVRSSRRSGNAADERAICKTGARSRQRYGVVLQQQLHHFAGASGPQLRRDLDQVRGATSQVGTDIAGFSRSHAVGDQYCPTPSFAARTHTPTTLVDLESGGIHLAH